MSAGDQPIMWQLEQMIKFCREYDSIFIIGTDHTEKMVRKYLLMAGISSVTLIDINALQNTDAIFQIDSYERCGVIAASSERPVNMYIVDLLEHGFPINQIYVIGDYNRKTISYKMTPRPKERMGIEVSLAEHCNLNCQMCDHFAPLAKPAFMNKESFERDIKRLAELTDGRIGMFRLEGGEPLLNDELLDYIMITRKYLPDAVILLFTDGLLLKKWENHPKGNLWQVCHDYNVIIDLTIYPINLKVEDIKMLEKKYAVKVEYFTEVGDHNYKGIKHSKKHPFRLKGDVESWQFIGCYQFNECMTLKNGKLYTCPMIPHIDHFNHFFNQNLEVTEDDFIDIYKVDSYEELAEFVAKRTHFCNYCHVKARRSYEWKQSERSLSEYVDEK